MSSARSVAKLFINYRREDTAPHAGRLYDRLVDHFGREHVFMDIDHIEPGEDFVEAINRKVGGCDVAIIMIGPEWLTVRDAAGQRRLDDSEDFVRMEIVAALQRNIRVIPILVGSARMPAKAGSSRRPRAAFAPERARGERIAFPRRRRSAD